MNVNKDIYVLDIYEWYMCKHTLQHTGTSQLRVAVLDVDHQIIGYLYTCHKCLKWDFSKNCHVQPFVLLISQFCCINENVFVRDIMQLSLILIIFTRFL